MALSHPIKALIMIFAVVIPAAFAATGDTWTADLAGNTLPPNSGLVKAKGSGTMTITEEEGDIYYWEVNIFDTKKFTSMNLILGEEGLPNLFTLANETDYIPEEIVYYGSFTRKFLDEQLAANGYDVSSLYGGEKLWGAVYFPNNSALAGPISATSEANFENVTFAPAPGEAPEDEFELSTQSIVYVAQMQNSSIPFFESGFKGTPGTGSMLLQDLLDGTFFWTLDTTFFRSPTKLELLYFNTLQDQPSVLTLKPDPKLADKVETYEGTFTLEELKQGLAAVGAPKEVLEKTFNVTPPRLFAKLDDKNNGSVLGFLFDANAAPTANPIVKGAANMLGAGGWATLVALILGIWVI